MGRGDFVFAPRSVAQSSLFFKVCCRAKYIPTKAAIAKKVKLFISNSLC